MHNEDLGSWAGGPNKQKRRCHDRHDDALDITSDGQSSEVIYAFSSCRFPELGLCFHGSVRTFPNQHVAKCRKVISSRATTTNTTTITTKNNIIAIIIIHYNTIVNIITITIGLGFSFHHQHHCNIIIFLNHHGGRVRKGLTKRKMTLMTQEEKQLPAVAKSF